MLRIVTTMLAAVFLCVTAATDALACTPAPEFQVYNIETDAPDCLEFTDGYGYADGLLRVTNGCTEEATVEGVDCAECGGLVTIAAGEQSDLVVLTTREPATHDITIGWTLGENSGTTTATVEWRDNSGACDPENWPEEELEAQNNADGSTNGSTAGSTNGDVESDDAGCATTTSSPAPHALILFVLVAGIRRRR